MVLATEEFPGVVGVVTAVNGGDEEPLVLETRRVPLARAYSEIGIHGKTLEQLADSSATDSLFSLRKFKCDRSGQAGEAAPPRIDFSLGSLTPDARIDLRSRELYFVLEGEPEISVDFSSQQAVHCEYDGPPRFHIPIHGSPLILTVSPALETEVSSGLGSSFSWQPKIEMGVDKPPRGEARLVHRLVPNAPGPPAVEGEGTAELLLGLRVGISVAGRAGLAGIVGPKVEATLRANGPSVCADASSSVRLRLTAHADVFIRKWSLPIAKRDFGNFPLWPFFACGEGTASALLP